MSEMISLEEAQIKLKDLIHQMAPGEELVITENQLPVAKLICERASSPDLAPRPAPGLGKGMITFIAADFDAPLVDMKEYME